jgi:Zn-finger nucleic acid-binding protein
MLLCCLKCTSVLDKTRIDDVEVDHCPACGGLWLDHGEIERLSRKMGGDVARLRRLLEAAAAASGPPAVPSEVQGSCPACQSQSVKEVALGKIHIDFCTRCKGLFLDRGEIDAAIATVKDTKMTVAQIVAAAGAAAEAAA